ncbi:Vacuolar transporter chaperone 4 [Nosema granulosis]|uniref:Vacuolar transporter chaperone 4 n=1 Tax=Nosema granulosis TaxID=83296 RepID=A0A9P6H0H1_9MICR|nr:Vacuolar transporter chaperone 4 [Nosema granulosis]
MRFQKYLKRNIYKPYRYYYLDYEILKNHIKPDFGPEDEEIFKSMLDENFSRVFGFVDSKQTELNRRCDQLYKSTYTNKLNLKITALSEEMRNFSEFIRINVVGFKKILSRHDKKTQFNLMGEYKSKLKEKIRNLESLDDLIYNSSKVVLKNSKIKTKKESGTTFIRRTDKYWVHKDNINSLKFFILQNLPIYVFTQNKDVQDFESWNKDTHDTKVSSVYLDNENFDLYTDRIHKVQNAEAIRIRWYGSTVPDVVFIERKRHEESWTGESSKKLRFMIHERNVNGFMAGRDVWEDVKSLNGEEVRELYTEIQNKIVQQKLRPVVRTYYKRQAFQLPNDSSVRLSLDTELCMIKETNSSFSWRREDVNTEYPFLQLPKSEIVRFPHGILEIKTQGVDETKPDWINELVSGPLIEHVHKFSKYLHGCAVLYPMISEIPYWLPQMATSIKKDSWDSEEGYKEFENGVLIDIPPKETFNSTLNSTINTLNTTDTINSELISPIDTHGKKIAIPVRVEPKVFFANERTFLSWVQFAIFLGGIGTAMLGLGESKAGFSGIILITVSVIFSFYSLYLYLWRAGMIRKRHPGPYDDIYGPPVLVCVFLLAMALSIIYKFPLKRI